MKNAEARKLLGITQTHLAMIKKAAQVPRGHNFDYDIIENFLKCNPTAKKYHVARDMAQGLIAISHTEYLGKITLGKKQGTPARIDWATRMDLECNKSLKRAQKMTRISQSKIVEMLIQEHIEQFIKDNAVTSPEYRIKCLHNEIKEAENLLKERKENLAKEHLSQAEELKKTTQSLEKAQAAVDAFSAPPETGSWDGLVSNPS